MNRLLLLTVLAVLFIACTNEQKCKKLIDHYYSKNLDDYSSYQSVEFGKLISDSSSFTKDSTFKSFVLKQKSFLFALGMISEKELSESGAVCLVDTNYTDGINNINFNDSLLYYMKKQADFVSSYKPKHIGWMIGNTYRTKIDGNLKLKRTLFHIDLECKNIISVDEWK